MNDGKEKSFAEDTGSATAIVDRDDKLLLEFGMDIQRWSDRSGMRRLKERVLQEDGDVFLTSLTERQPDLPKKKFLQALSAQIQTIPEGVRVIIMPVEYAEEIKDLQRNNDGTVRSSLENYCLILDQDPQLMYKIRLNALSGRVMLSGASWDITPHPIRDLDLYQIRKIISERYGISNVKDIQQAVEITGYKYSFHPIRELLSSLKWDGQERIGELFPRFLGADRSDYTTTVTKLLLFGAIQRVMNPGVKFDLCIILADTRQGTGKSSICRFLALRDDWFCDGLDDLSDNKRAYEAIRGHWICELGEMIATNRAKDVEGIKSYLSRTADDYRDPYGVYSERRPRQCVFIGTSNKPDFLPRDRSGNRRFLPIICDGSKAEVHPMANERETRDYILQCYAEAMQIGEEEGWPLVLPKNLNEEAMAIRDSSSPEDTRVGIIQTWLDQTDEDVVCTKMIWDRVFPDQIPKDYELQEIAAIMTMQIRGWSKYNGNKSGKKRVKGYGTQRAWIRDVIVKDVATPEFVNISPETGVPF